MTKKGFNFDFEHRDFHPCLPTFSNIPKERAYSIHKTWSENFYTLATMLKSASKGIPNQQATWIQEGSDFFWKYMNAFKRVRAMWHWCLVLEK